MALVLQRRVHACLDTGVRLVCTLCLVCKRAVTRIVDRDRFDRLEFLQATAHIPRVPPIAEKRC